MKIDVLEYCAPDLADRINEWRRWLQFEKNLSRHTLRAYESDIGCFITFLCDHQDAPPSLDTLSTTDLKDFRSWISSLAIAGHSASSRARALSTIRNFLSWLDNQGIMHNPAISLVRMPKLPHKLPRPLYIKQAKKLLEECGSDCWVESRNTALFTLLYGCGLRIDEALSLNISNLPHGGFLRVMGKGRKERQVPVLKIVNKKINIYRKDCPFTEEPERPLFLGVRGKRLNQGIAQKEMRNLRRDLTLPETATPHALRHSFATHLLQNGANLREIQEMLGHASLRSTQRYTEVDAKKLLKVYKETHPRSKQKND